MTTPRQSVECRSCGAPIVFARTASGRLAPFNATPIETTFESRGLFALVGGQGSGGNAPEAVKPPLLYRSHFATCPNAAEHRTKGGKPR